MSDTADHRTPEEREMARIMARRTEAMEVRFCADCGRPVFFTYSGRCRACDMILHPEKYR